MFVSAPFFGAEQSYDVKQTLKRRRVVYIEKKKEGLKGKKLHTLQMRKRQLLTCSLFSNHSKNINLSRRKSLENQDENETPYLPLKPSPSLIPGRTRS